MTEINSLGREVLDTERKKVRVEFFPSQSNQFHCRCHRKGKVRECSSFQREGVSWGLGGGVGITGSYKWEPIMQEGRVAM